MTGNAGTGRPRMTYIDLIGGVLQKGQVRITRKRRVCMNVDEARGACKDRNKCRSVVSAYPHGKKV